MKFVKILRYAKAAIAAIDAFIDNIKDLLDDGKINNSTK